MPDVLLTSGYDPAGNRKSLSATIAGAKDFLTSYSYNTLSQLDEIDQQGQSGGNAVAMKSIYFGLDAIGDITQIDRSNSVYAGPNQNGPAYSVLSYSPPTGLLTGINHEYMGASLDNLSYTYDTLARVSTFGSIDGTATYGYDPTSQVVSATYTTAPGGHQPDNEARSYDPNGNQTTSGFTVGADNHLTSDGTFNFTFDPSGNLSTRIRISNAAAADYKTVYLWDFRDRLTDVEFFNNSGVLTQHVHYVYGVWDHLIERDLDPNGSGTYIQTVHYVWDGDNIVLAFDGHQNLIARYLNGPDTSAYDQYFSTLAEEDVSSLTAAGTVTFPLLDQQGTVRDVVDSHGNLIDHISYNLNGQVVNESNPSAPHLTSWQGGITDPVSEMEKMGARWYILVDAVWASQDPVGLVGDINLSRVDANDPLNLSDPSGLWPGGGQRNVRPPVFQRGTGPQRSPNQPGSGPGSSLPPIREPIPWVRNPVACSEDYDQLYNDVLKEMAWRRAEQRAREIASAERQMARRQAEAAKATARLQEELNTTGAPVSREKAAELLQQFGQRPIYVKGAPVLVGFDETTADSYVDSMNGTVRVRRVQRGEEFRRYANHPDGPGSFLSKTIYTCPQDAVDALNLAPYKNRAVYRQKVTANRTTYVLEGDVRGGSGSQQVILEPDAFDFDAGVGTSTGLRPGAAGPPAPPAASVSLP